MILYAVIENNSPENAPAFETLPDAIAYIKRQQDGKERWVHSVEFDVMKKIGQVLIELKQDDPYPPDIFERPSTQDWDLLPELFKSAGLNQSPFFADAMSRSYNNALFFLEKRLADFFD